MANKKMIIGLVSLLAIVILSACAEQTEDTNNDNNTEQNSEDSTHDDMEGMDHSEMHMSGSGEVPEGLQEADNPTYEVGSKAIIESNHMEGMKGAEATIVGAYDTTVYTVSYMPTTGGEEVSNHKWVIHEELEDPSETPLEPGDEAVLNADHMKGMDGATAQIDSAEETTVYMVDFALTTSGEEVTNHKWVTEDELSPME